MQAQSSTTLCPEKSAPTTFVNNNFKSLPIVKIVYTQNQQYIDESILFLFK